MTWIVPLLLLGFADRNTFDIAQLPQTFESRDTLDIGDEPNPDALQCLRGLTWEPRAFSVECLQAEERCDVYLKFPSPVVTGDVRNDVVVVEGSLAKDSQGRVLSAPAIVVVHESGSAMPVGRLMAAGLRERGLHAFMVQLPHYGQRRTGKKAPQVDQFSTGMRQAIADVRRARDAVGALPMVQRENIGVQGTSLGGFVTATAAALDHGFQKTFILLAGGDLARMMANGRREVAQARRELAAAGIEGDALKALVNVVEPNRVAHRLRPEQTWLYSAILDQVVPLENGIALAQAAQLSKSHHIRLLADHYTGIVYLPLVLNHIQGRMLHDASSNPSTKKSGMR